MSDYFPALCTLAGMDTLRTAILHTLHVYVKYL